LWWTSRRKAGGPAATAGIVSARIVVGGRTWGETIAIMMVIGKRPVSGLSLFAPSYTLASVIANEFTEATTDVYLSSLVELGLLLLIVSIIVNGAARMLMWSVFRGARSAR